MDTDNLSAAELRKLADKKEQEEKKIAKTRIVAVAKHDIYWVFSEVSVDRPRIVIDDFLDESNGILGKTEFNELNKKVKESINVEHAFFAKGTTFEAEKYDGEYHWWSYSDDPNNKRFKNNYDLENGDYETWLPHLKIINKGD